VAMRVASAGTPVVTGLQRRINHVDWGSCMRALAIHLMLAALLGAFGMSSSASEFEAGPLWNDGDARAKCPAVCSRNGNQYWTGNWRTTVPNLMSVCSCEINTSGNAANPPSDSAPNAYPPTQGDARIMRYDFTDFMGNDLPGGSLHAPSFDDCARQCMAEPACAVFTYNARLNKCYRKIAAANATQTNDSASGVITGRGSAPAVMPPPSYPVAPAPSAPAACSIGGTPKCPGCSVSCPPGRTPVCSPAVDGVTSFCARNALCKCE